MFKRLIDIIFCLIIIIRLLCHIEKCIYVICKNYFLFNNNFLALLPYYYYYYYYDYDYDYDYYIDDMYL